MPNGDSGLFKVNKPDSNDGNISSDYLVETNSRFIDTSSFLGSDYFLQRIGFDPNADTNVQRLGDAVYEQRLIMDAINRVNNFEYLEEDIGSDHEQVQRLYDNAFLEYDKNPDFEVGKALTEEQINNLEKDIIWLVEKEVDGKNVLVTQVYFAPDTITKLAEKDDHTGSLIKAGEININTEGDIDNNFGSIIATDSSLILNAGGNINLLNSILNSDGVTSISAKENISIENSIGYQAFYTPEIISKTASQPIASKVAGLFAATSTISPEAQNIIDDAINARSAATFNAGSDIQIVSGSNINIAHNQVNTGGSIFLDAANDVNNSNYTLKASDNVVINAGNDVNNIHTINSDNETRIEAGKLVSIDAGNDITNRGATIEAGEILYLTAGNNINNEALITRKINGQIATREEVENSNADNISSVLESQGNLTSDGNLVLIAGNNINNVASNITTTGANTNFAGEAYIEATAGDVNIVTDTLRDRTVNRWKRGISIEDSTTNVSSNVDIASNLTVVSGNDTNIKGSNILATGNADIKTGGELNITSAEDSYYKYVATKKKKSFGRSKSSTSLTETKTQVASNIVVGGDIMLDGVSDVNILASNLRGENGQIISQAGNVNIKNGINSVKSYTTSKKKGSTAKSSSKVYDYQETAAESSLAFNNDLKINSELGDVNIQGSTLDVNNDLSFGSFTIAQNPDGSLKTKADGTFETVSGDVVQNVNITAAELKSEHWEERKSTSFNPITAAMAAVGEVASLGGLNPVVDKLNEKLQERVNDMVGSGNEAVIEKTENKSGKSETIAHSSNITVDGNLNVNAAEGFKIAASNLDVGGDGNINAAKVDIISVAENSSSYTKDKSIEIGETDVGFRDNSFKAGIKGTGEENLYQEETSVQKASNVNIGNNLLINSTNDIDVVASNVAVGNDATIKTGGNFNLSDAKNTQKTNTENSKLEVEVGVKVGNAYVDAGVAVKALADATKNLKKSKEKLSKMKRLKSEGRASQKAVDLAITQVTLATAGVATTTANVAMAAQNAATAASTSLGTGMYAAGYMDTTHHTDFLKTNSEQSVGSTFIAGNNIDINANKDYNQTGSIIKSNSGDINIAAASANIKSGENTFQSEFGSKTTTASVSVGNNGVGLNAGYNQSDNFILQNTHTNSEILAENGTFNLNTTGDTNIKGGNVTANQVALNIGGDLNLETLQDTYEQQGSSFGLGVGVGVNQSASLNNASISLGATEIFTKTTGKRTGIVALASNDNNLSEAENLTNLLASTSVNVAGNIDNQTVKKDIDFTNADFEGTLSVPVELFTESGRARMKDAFENLGRNLATATTGAIFNATDSVAVAINKTTGKSKKGIVEGWKEARTESTQNLKTYMENYDKREKLTQAGYDYYKSLTDQQIENDLVALPADKSIYHTYKLDEQGNPINIISEGQKNYIKYIHDKKGYEIVVDNSDKRNPVIVTDPVNKGTYNHFSPGGLTNNVGHVLLDVLPYFVHGNDEKILPDSSTPTDSTWAIDRIGRTLYKPEQ